MTQTTPFEVAGVVSWGAGVSCDTYTVFARVSTFAEWIDARVPVHYPAPALIMSSVQGMVLF